ncbi:Oidioi.mRNA.OKI2018_I69.XSR.g13724.t1.cds [Oikopleura dioica]|uniref:Oidioi.mRNA.OKI2018_I69.XSR.g13724.t1.cds n=1 Tax=Oikopleura dioica TaxID=34765 RepID=A0ABN7SER3_OIKDI|nr:Oidioi.mRNA.OKI2018_I69.XSR.g13724.t1.cds [Oikopleura dioica]
MVDSFEPAELEQLSQKMEHLYSREKDEGDAFADGNRARSKLSKKRQFEESDEEEIMSQAKKAHLTVSLKEALSRTAVAREKTEFTVKDCQDLDQLKARYEEMQDELNNLQRKYTELENKVDNFGHKLDRFRLRPTVSLTVMNRDIQNLCTGASGLQRLKISGNYSKSLHGSQTSLASNSSTKSHGVTGYFKRKGLSLLGDNNGQKVRKTCDVKKITRERSVVRRLSQGSLKGKEETKERVQVPDDEVNLAFPLNEPGEDRFGAIRPKIEPWRQAIWDRLPAEKKMIPFPSYEPYSFTSFEYVRARELKPKHVVDPAYLQKHKVLSPRHRYILVNWMMEVQESDDHYFRNEQLFQAVRFIDVYLSKTESLELDRFQLLGITAMFVACKIGMQDYADIKSWAILGDPEQPYDTADIRRFEIKLMQAIDWDAEISTAYYSQKRLSMLAKLKDHQCHMVRYQLELSLLASELVPVRPSIVTAAAVLVAKTYFGQPVEWDDYLAYHSGYRLHDLLPVCKSLVYLMKNAYSIGKANLKGAKNIVFAKYSSDDCANIALLDERLFLNLRDLE